MINRLRYMMLTILLLATMQVAGQYSIDKVCMGTERYYRVTGELNSTYSWQVTDTAGVVIPQTSNRDTVGILWNMAPGVYSLSVIQHAQNGCDADLELGTVEVFGPPAANAGYYPGLCAGSTLLLSQATASNYSGIVWTTSGDGIFNDSSLVNPVYTPGTADSALGHYTLTITATGLGNAGTCTPASSSVTVRISSLIASETQTNVSCFGLANGIIQLTASSGIEPYTYAIGDSINTTGLFTSLIAGLYSYTITDSIGCQVQGVITIDQPDELLAHIVPLTSEICMNSPLLFTSTFTGGTGTNVIHEWTGSGAIYLDSTNVDVPVFTASIPGTYTLVYKVTDENGCDAVSEEAIIAVNSLITPMFVQPGPLCQNSIAPALPDSSTNGINGTWTPAIINTSLAGIAVYIFIPDSGQCAVADTMNIVITNEVTPVFTTIGPLCQNSIAPALPDTSVNGISGTWTPATVNTAIAGNTTYIFTPDSGQCAVADTMNIVITNEVTPVFTSIVPLCQNSIAPALPDTSVNGIGGTWTPATINTAIAGPASYIFTPDSGQCAVADTMNIVITNEVTPVFTSIGQLCQNSIAPALPDTSVNGIIGTWTPATINTAIAGPAPYIFTPDSGQCAVADTMNIVITNEITPVFASIGPLCQNSIAPALPGTSVNGISGTWTPATINTSIAGTTAFFFTPDSGQCAVADTMNIVITNEITPVFASIGPLCQNSLAPALPDTSVNGISGTWTPATINTSIAGTTAFFFTPDSGQCAVADTMNIVITNEITPVFASIGPLCQNSIAPALPDTSVNGISGTWTPATINTSIAGTTAFFFTPDSGQCAVADTINIVITNEIIPVFASIGPLCQNSIAPALPDTSVNGISGTWTPATINTSIAGTTAFFFTPDSGQCAVADTMNIVITNEITPVFASIGPLCQNSIAPAIPDTSVNGISGNWTPATINTAIAGTASYIFTPDSGQCAVADTMNIVITNEIIPVFAAIGPLCQNSIAPALPDTSVNGISGNWTPATIITAIAGTASYIFTPDSGQCAVADTMNIVITNEIIPVFAAIGPLCQNSIAPALPDTSVNGISGNWTPATINTAIAGTTSYIFTPDSGQCAVADTMNIVITNEIIPVFAAIGPLCQNSIAPALPDTSVNGISGNWTPSTINTTFAGTIAFIFIPDSGQCAVADTMNIVITNEIIPLFTSIGPLCQNSAAPSFPIVSNNGITGTWNPPTINTTIADTLTFTFTPDSGQCAIADTMNIVITNEIIPVFAAIGPLCQNSTAPLLPVASTNGISGTWNPPTINTTIADTLTFTFTPDTGQCAVIVTTNIIITNEIVPLFAAIGPLCQNSIAPLLPVASTNGITGTWTPSTINTAIAGISVYTFTPDTSQCSGPVTLNIEITNEITPLFTQIGPLYQNTTAPALPSISNNGITGTWLPATINTAVAGTTTYTFTPDSGQCAIVVTMNITVTGQIVPVFVALGPFCQNSSAPTLPATSTNGITGTWVPATINTAVTGTTSYIFTPDTGQSALAVTIEITITNEIVPTFTVLGPFALNSVAPSLPGTSLNGITGSWNPATISTAAAGITTYTFTPDTAQCAVAVTMEILVADAIVPTFADLGPFCQYSVAPALPATSLNGITGTWNPAVINTTVAGTFNFTFTPNAGQGAMPVTIGIMISDQIVPLFTNPGPLCLNSTPPALPGTSLNGITGTWVPAAINSAATGTTVYTFTPGAGQCAVPATMPIVITNQVVPTFTALGPFCQNSVPPSLPATSLNGITGTWVPATINTAIPGSSAYTFTPNAGQCAVATATMNIVITNQIVPVFTTPGPFCQFSVPTALPATSFNGIAGTWAPAAINTSIAGPSVYTFTPNSGQCASVATITVNITNQIVPAFITIGPFCQGSTAPSLPSISMNGLAGTWYPASINTSVTGTSSYTFTPGTGQCASAAVIAITITEKTNPVFTTAGPFCQNGVPTALPTTSNNGITGTWAPASISTAVIGLRTYTFTPTLGLCANPATMVVEITDKLIPVFAPIGPLCLNSVPPSLPDTSVDGIHGTWTPAVISTITNGTTSYSFIPDTGQCAVAATIQITVTSPSIIDISTFNSTNGFANGRAVIIAEGLAVPLTYSLNGTDWQTQREFTDLLAGNYTGWVKDAYGCITNRQFVIMNIVVGEIEIAAGEQISCISIPVTIPVIAYNFTNVSSFTIEMKYDTSILMYNGLSQLNNTLTNGNITVSVAEGGTLRITFTAKDSVSLLNDDLLFMLNFQGLSEGQAKLMWNLLNCVIYTSSGYEIPTIYTQGQILIRPLPQMFTTGSGEYCENTPLELGAGSLTGQILRYSWVGPGSDTHLGEKWDLGPLQIADSGEYRVTGIDRTGCAKTEKVDIIVHPNPVVELADNDTLCSEQVIELNAGPGYVDYLWQDGTTEPKQIVIDEGLYWVVVTDENGCKGSDSAFLRPCELLIWMPNAFTPNGDGLNDVFLAKHHLDLDINFRMSVFNKWGEELFTSNNINKGWDGTYKGKLCPPDQYTWIISFSAPPTFNFIQKSPQRGSVMLLK